MICKEKFNLADSYELMKVGNSAIVSPKEGFLLKPITFEEKEEELLLLKDFHELSNDIVLLLQILDLNIIQDKLDKASKTLDLIYDRLFLLIQSYGPLKSKDDTQNLTNLLLDDEFMRTVLYCSFDRIKSSLDFIDGKEHTPFPERLNKAIAEKPYPYQKLKDLRNTFLKEGTGMSPMIQANIYTTFAEFYKLVPDIDDERPRKFSQKQKETPDIYRFWLEEGKDSDLFATHLWTYYLEGIKTATNGIIEFHGKLDLDINVSFDAMKGHWELCCNPKNLLEAIQCYKFFGEEGNPAYISKCLIPECNNMITNDRRHFCSTKHGVNYQNRMRLARSKRPDLAEADQISNIQEVANETEVKAEAKIKEKKNWTIDSEDDATTEKVKIKG